VTRRRVLGLIGLSTILPTVGEAQSGFSLRGRLDATGTERSERTVNFGKSFAWIVNDAALWAEIEPLIDSNVRIHVIQG
jgi:hypothetical protein